MNNWKPIKEVYNYDDEESFYCSGDYEPLLESYGYLIVEKEDDHDYQGDSRVLYYDNINNKLGVLIFGWGSCSGCDALQACSSLKDIEELRESFHNNIRWFDSIYSLKEYIEEFDHEGQYYCHQTEWANFINKVSTMILKLEEIITHPNAIELVSDNVFLREFSKNNIKRNG